MHFLQSVFLGVSLSASRVKRGWRSARESVEKLISLL